MGEDGGGSTRAIRFAFGTRDRPQSATWRAWVQGDELYVAARPIGNEFKLSFHGDRKCHLAFDAALAPSLKVEGAPLDAGRYVAKWTQPDGKGGWRQLVHIVTPHDVLRAPPAKLDQGRVVFVDPPGLGSSGCFTVWLGEDPGDALVPAGSEPPTIVGSLRLRRGDPVFITAQILGGEFRLSDDARPIAEHGAVSAEQQSKARSFYWGLQDNRTGFVLERVVPISRTRPNERPLRRKSPARGRFPGPWGPPPISTSSARTLLSGDCG